MWRGVTIGASSRLGTGGAMTVSPEGNRRTQLPFRVVPTTLADSDPTRIGARGRRTEDLATRWRRNFVSFSDAIEASRFLETACSDDLGGSSAGVAAEEGSLAVIA